MSLSLRSSAQSVGLACGLIEHVTAASPKYGSVRLRIFGGQNKSRLKIKLLCNLILAMFDRPEGLEETARSKSKQIKVLEAVGFVFSPFL